MQMLTTKKILVQFPILKQQSESRKIDLKEKDFVLMKMISLIFRS